jgi:hypothetical protein
VLVMDPDCCFRSGSNSKLNYMKICCLVYHYNRTVNSGMVQWKYPNESKLGVLSVGCAVGLPVNSYNGPVLAVG